MQTIAKCSLVGSRRQLITGNIRSPSCQKPVNSVYRKQSRKLFLSVAKKHQYKFLSAWKNGNTASGARPLSKGGCVLLGTPYKSLRHHMNIHTLTDTYTHTFMPNTFQTSLSRVDFTHGLTLISPM